MKRWPPFNQPDGTPWENGNPATGKRGSVIDSRAIDHAQAEITNAIKRFGLTPDANNLEQLGLAIQNYVNSLTGEGGDDAYLTVPSARATLPIYPEVLTADGRLAISSPSSGTLFVAASGAIRHRGVADILMSDIAEVDRTFNMLPSKVAHLRWSPSGSLQRFYLDDETYNPLGLPETNPAFDAGYDSALLARVTTDASANLTITPLVNRDRIELPIERTQLFSRTPNNAYIAPFDPVTWDLARTPKVTASAQLIGYPAGDLPRAFTGCATYLSGTRSDTTGGATARLDRYGMAVVGEVQTGLVGSTPGVFSWSFLFQLRALAVA